MNFFETIDNDIKNAIKAKDNDKLTAIRAIKSELLLLKTSGKAEITDDDILKMLQKMIKQRQQSAEIYKDQNRQDMYDSEMSEISFITPYLPAQMSDDEIETEIKAIITETGATSIKEMGKVMGLATKKLQGKADGKKISDLVKKLLS